MQVMIYKMIDGSEVIGEEMDGKVQYFVKRPRILIMQQTQHGVQAGLIPYIMAAPDAEVLLNGEHVTACVNAPSDIEKAYLQQVSGLQMASTLMG